MANRFRGEITAACDGVSYTLRMDMNTLAAFENATAELSLDFLETVEKGKASVADMVVMLHCAMLRHQPDATSEHAGDLLSDDSTTLMRLLQAAAPQPEASAPGNPPAPAAAGRD